MSDLVREIISEDETDELISVPIPKVTGHVLGKVMDFCTYYTTQEEMNKITTPLKSNSLEDLVQEWYVEYVNMDRELLFQLVAAANFMDIKELLDLTCLAVAIAIKGKSAQELRTMFQVSEELDPEETNANQVENQWVDPVETNNNEN